MKMAILGDLHDNLRHLNVVIDEINKIGVDLVAFTGDFDMPFTMRAFTRFQSPIKAVLGNGDPDIQKFEYQLDKLDVLKNLDLDISFRFQDFKFDGKRVGIFHGDDDNLNKVLVECQLFDVLCIGHNHLPKIKKEGKTLVVNPGSLVGWMLERGNMPITYAIYNSETEEAVLHEMR